MSQTTSSFLLGNLRNSTASTSRKFKYCNHQSPSLDVTFQCVFNTQLTKLSFPDFNHYHILNPEEIPISLDDQDQIDDENFPKSKAIINGPFTPAHINSVYNVTRVPPAVRVRPVVITIVGAFSNPYLINDLRTFGKMFGLPPCKVAVYNFSRYFNVSWAVEQTMDVQWAYAMNPYAQFRVVQAATASNADIFRAIAFANNRNNFTPKVDSDILTMSFGIPDTGRYGAFNSYFSNSNTIYIAASGDSSLVAFPSCCTNVVAVGGTTLKLNSADNSRANEKVWSASGCGYSQSFTRPSYQPTNRSNKRITPDLSCVGDPNTGLRIVLNGRVYSVGGTSVSAPICAGKLSLLQQQRLNKGQTTYTSVQQRPNTLQPLLYTKPSCFYDVVMGSSGPYTASNGFDVASGLGVPISSSLLSNL